MKDNSYSLYARVSQLGVQTILSLLISIFIGIWLDEKFNTEPIFIIFFIFFGIATCFRNFYVFYKKFYGS